MKNLQEIYNILFESYNEELWDSSENTDLESDIIKSNIDKLLSYSFNSVQILNTSNYATPKELISALDLINQNIKILLDPKTADVYNQFVDYLVNEIWDKGNLLRVNKSLEFVAEYFRKSYPTKITFIMEVLFSTFNTHYVNTPWIKELPHWSGNTLVQLYNDVFIVSGRYGEGHELDEMLFIKVSDNDINGSPYRNKIVYWNDLIIKLIKYLCYKINADTMKGYDDYPFIFELANLTTYFLHNIDVPSLKNTSFWGVPESEYNIGENVYVPQAIISDEDFYTILDNFILQQYNLKVFKKH